MSSVDLAVYEMLAKETLRRVFAEEDVESLQAWLMGQVVRLGGGVDEDAVLTWAQSFDFYDELLARREQQALLPAAERKELQWPWLSWSKLIDPLEPGMLAVLAAGDGMGKTIYGESIAEYWARHRNRVVFVHFELNRALMMDRRTARHTSILRRDLKSGMLTVEQKRMVAEVRPRLLAWDGYVTYLHTPGWSMEKVVQKLAALKLDGGCDVVVLDYLEKAAPSQRQLKMFGSNVFQREADNVEQIKNWSEQSEVPVLMLAQMSKEGKKQDVDTMDRTGIRGAGEKTEKANVVVLLNRKREEDTYSNTVDVRVDKNTIGATGGFQQWMQPEFFRVTDVERVAL